MSGKPGENRTIQRCDPATIQDVVLRLREDAVSEPNNREANQANAPAVENCLFLVPKVIE